MIFQSADPSVIKSVKQLDLLNTWLRLHAKRQSVAPPAAEYRPARIEDEMADMVYYRVEWSRGTARIVIESDGSRIAAAYGKAEHGNKGAYLDEYLNPEAAPEVLAIYHECIQRARPVYTISMVEDVAGRRVAYERLLLPFSDGTLVTDIIASLKTISEEGRFEIRNLLRPQDRKPTYIHRAVIDRSATGQPPACPPSEDDIVEI